MKKIFLVAVLAFFAVQCSNTIDPQKFSKTEMIVEKTEISTDS